jgi:predicted nucleic acid-binding protein
VGRVGSVPPACRGNLKEGVIGHTRFCELWLRDWYEMFWNIQKFIRAANDPTNRSLLKYPPRRLQRVLEADSRHMTQVKDLLDSQGLLDEIDGEVLDLLQQYPIGSNDALILAYLRRLQERLALQGRQLVFVCSDDDLKKAVRAYLTGCAVKDPKTDQLP